MTAFVQAKYGAVIAGTSVSITLDTTPVVGNLLVSVLTSNNTLAAPVHTWSASPDVVGGTVGVSALTYVCSKVAGAAESATVPFSNTSSRNFGLTVMEFAPTSGKSWAGIDKTASAVGATVATLLVGPTATQSDTDDVAVAGIASSAAINTATPTMSDGYTVTGGLATIARGFAGYKLLSSTAATQTTGTWTSTGNPGGALVTYTQGVVIPPPAPGGQNLGFFALL